MSLKVTLKYFFYKIGKVVGYCLSNNLFKLFSFIYRYIYTGYKAMCFSEYGHNSLIIPKINVIGGDYIKIGSNCFFDKGICLHARSKYLNQNFTPQLTIGSNTSIGENSHITCINRITIGNGVLFGKNVLVTDNSHGNTNINETDICPAFRKLFSKGQIIIGDNVWVGEKSTILPNVILGKGVIVAANSVVTKNVPDYAIVAGVPAKVIKYCNNVK